MTKTYATKRLLEHGPLILRDFYTITGWKKTIAWATLQALIFQGLVTIRNINGKRHYALTEAA